MNIIFVLIGLVLGIPVGLFLSYFITPFLGTLVVNESDEEKDIYRIELNADPKEVSNKKNVFLRVKHEKDNSQD